MGRARSAQASFEFGSSGSGAARLPIEMGQTWGKKFVACDDIQGGSPTLSVTGNCLRRAVILRNPAPAKSDSLVNIDQPSRFPPFFSVRVVKIDQT
jgi:hypothetical protein